MSSPESRPSRCSKAATRRSSCALAWRAAAWEAFRYHDKGNLATIGRGAAVADIRGLKLSGLPAWIAWVIVHLWYLVGFANRMFVFIRWAVSFITHGRGARVITVPEAYAEASRAPARRGEAGLQDAAAQRSKSEAIQNAAAADG